ncbi:sialidase family protein [Porphyromonas pogonae]|uniref:sialidase family protein n=1 Tax=Porphyromonas pogonae TaxID=867595 RepID=UPI002E77438F|nr:sialidase family protein [Porphyromonas pogonae]
MTYLGRAFKTLLFSTLCISATMVAGAQTRSTAKPVPNKTNLDSIASHATNASLIGRGSNQPISVYIPYFDKADKAGGIKEFTFDLTGSTDPKDIVSARLYLSDINDRYSPTHPLQLIGEGAPEGDKLAIKGNKGPIRWTPNKCVWLVYTIADNAKEGNIVQTKPVKLQMDNCDSFDFVSTPPTSYEIVLQRTLLWSPGDKGAASYRIPGIVTCADGSLVVSADRRKNNSADLPNDIDVEVKRSFDGGKTWSQPITVAKGSPSYGYGDAAIAVNGNTITMMFIGGKTGLWGSTPENRLNIYVSQSFNSGRSWSAPRKISDPLYKKGKWPGGFIGSGRGIVTSKGVIIFVGAFRTSAEWGGKMANVLVYSEDGGKTWKTSNPLRFNGDESKVVELADGRLLVSSRNRDKNPNNRSYAITSNLGMTWTQLAQWPEINGNNCNASILRYSLIKEGAKKDRLLHTLPANEERTNLTLFLSTDEGKTWPVKKVICKGEAAYSELTVMPDGTIGIISEEDDHPAYDIYFTRVSLEWLTNGKDTTDKPSANMLKGVPFPKRR